MTGQPSPPTRLFALCYVLAMFGAFVAFIPLGALILPQKIAAIDSIVDGGARVRALSWLLVAGGVTAGFGNIVAGHASDRLYRRRGSRRRMVAVGLVATVAALTFLGATRSFGALILAVILLQMALNLLLSPLVTLMVDYVPDGRKGAMAGWLGLALPVGSLVVPLLVAVQAIGSAGELAVMSGLAIALVAPLVLLWPVRARAGDGDPVADQPPDAVAQSGLLRNFTLAWVARLLVQFSAAAILPYLYFYLDGVVGIGNPGAVARSVGALALVFAAATTGGGLIAGALSDRAGHRRPVLITAALLVALGMAVLAAVPGWPLIVTGYALFAAGLGGFLTVDSALVGQLISNSGRRATLLGLINLTNTLPGILAPMMTLIVVADGAAAGVMAVTLALAAAGALIAALCVGQIRLRNGFTGPTAR